MQLWLIPCFYAIASIIGGFALPRLEARYFGYHLDISVASAQAYLSAVASGMMALTGIVFSIAFVLVQFNAIVYSPRLVVWLARDRMLFHAMGVFVATFMYSLSTLAWTDRSGAGVVPLFSCAVVALMLVASVLLLSLLVQRLNSLQITQVLQIIGGAGRDVIRQTYRSARPPELHQGGGQQRLPNAPALTIRHVGRPRTVTSIDLAALADQARQVDGTIVVDCAVGDTILEKTRLLRAYGRAQMSEPLLRRAIHVGDQRTFEQDPKYALRLLVDIAIKALSPAINDPTTAVQAIDQIEDLLRRLAKCDLETSRVVDRDGIVRVIYQMPGWADYLALAFDEIRQFGATSIQVMRRLRSALVGIAECVDGERARLVQAYLDHLDLSIERSTFDAEDRAAARVEDRQGLGLSHRNEDPEEHRANAPTENKVKHA
ncbi:MAG TPA: DUF2254 domain-containing protein [Bradyrhizobium sp.]|nr:DUF2254 domain-containing protein [Bradyrhizobium sp.]